MSRQATTAEVMLISALINSQDVQQAQKYGITPDYIEGYPDEYNWLLRYEKNYDCQPSRDAFKQAFPEFPLVEHEDVRSAVDAVFRAYGRRNLTAAMTRAFDLLGVGDLDLAYEEVRKAEPRRTHPKPRKALTDLGFLDSWDEPVLGVEVPYPTLQRATGGIQPGNLWYLAARPGQGKTAHLCNIVKSAVMSGNRVRFFSLEMSEPEVRARFHAMFASQMEYPAITLDAIRRRTVEKALYKEFVQDLDDRMLGWGGFLDIRTPRQGACTPGVVAAGADEYHLTVIDYIGLMKADGGQAAVDDWRLAAKISNAIKEIGLAAMTGMLAAAQINRDGDTGTSPPKIKNLAQSDALGQDGDVVLTQRAKPHNVASHFLLDKNRHGPSGIEFYTSFDPNRGQFREINSEAVEGLVIDAEMSL